MDILTEFTLDIQKLRDWRKWRINSRQYMENVNPKLSLYFLVNDYYKVINEFHNKLNKLISEHHRRDMEELYELRLAFTRQYVLEGGLITDK